MADNTRDLPNYVRPEAAAAMADLNLIRHLLGGSRAMWDNSQTYIRKWADEAQIVYDIRRKIETLFGGFERTLSAGTGMIFANPPKMEWNAAQALCEDDWADIDGLGTKGDVFAKLYTHEALADGFAAILVDHPKQPQGVLVHPGNQRQLGLRPKWALYTRAQIINWRYRIDPIDGQMKLVLAVLKEAADEDDGLYGVKMSVKYRVLRLVNGLASWTLYRQVKDPAQTPDAFLVEGSGFFTNKNGDIAPFIPLSIGYTGTTNKKMTANIPLLGVAFANLAYWQQATNLRFYREVAAFPQPTVSGALMKEQGRDNAGNITLVDGRLRLGPLVWVNVKEGGEYKWTELEGKSLEQVEKGCQNKLLEMAQQGISFLTKDKRAAETVEAKRLDAVAENSTLATSAQGSEDGLNGAWKMHAWYYGIDDPAQAPQAEFNRDFEQIQLPADMMNAYINAADKIKLPVEIVLEAFKSGGRIPQTTDIQETARQMMADQAAAQEQAVQLAQTRGSNNDTGTGGSSGDNATGGAPPKQGG